MRAIHFARLDKTRLVLVLTRDVALGRRRTVTLAAITSTVRGLATEVPVGAESGLDHRSAVSLDNIFAIDQNDRGRRIGYLLDAQERTLVSALSHAFDLDVVTE